MGVLMNESKLDALIERWERNADHIRKTTKAENKMAREILEEYDLILLALETLRDKLREDKREG